MKKCIILLSLVSLVFSVPGQITFERYYQPFSNPLAYSCLQNFDGGYFITGTSEEDPNNKTMFMRTDEFGEVLWAHQVPDSLSAQLSVGYSSCLASDNSFVVCGKDSCGCDIFILKITQEGDINWFKLIDVPGYYAYGFNIKPTLDNGYIIAGYDLNKRDALLIKTNSNGDTLWTKLFGIADELVYYVAHGVVQTTDSGFVVVGESMDGNTCISSIIVLKTDQSGNLLWLKSYLDYNTLACMGSSIAQTQDQGFIITGSTGFDRLLLRINENGDSLWLKGIQPGGGKSIKVTNDQGFIITGGYQLTKTDSLGIIEWNRIFNNNSIFSQEVEVTYDSGYVVAGFTATAGILDQTYLLKVNANGLVTTLQEQPKTTDLGVYPNPFRDKVAVLLDPECESVSVLDIYGRVILETHPEPGVKEISLDMSVQKPGVYLLVVTGLQGTLTQKIIHL